MNVTIDMNAMTPEMKAAILTAAAAATITSKSIHVVGDNTVKMLRKLADGIEIATNWSADKGGKAQILAVPAAKTYVINPIIDFSGRVKIGVVAGVKAAVAPKTATVDFGL